MRVRFKRLEKQLPEIVRHVLCVCILRETNNLLNKSWYKETWTW